MINLDGLEQILWPVHCVQEEPGAAFAPELETGRFQRVFRKGTNPQIDSYSGFYDNGHRKATGLAEFLRKRGVTEVVVAGVATDYCVKFTVLDAIEEGFAVTVVTDGCRGVEMAEGDVKRALRAMRDAGANLVTSMEIG